MNAYEREAYELGQQHGRNAASWVVDGNTSQEHIARMVAWMDAGDPRVDDYIPRRPDLSGEWADDPTPSSLYRDITGRDETTGNALSFETDHGWLIDAIADAYEAGVADTFYAACEAEVRGALS